MRMGTSPHHPVGISSLLLGSWDFLPLNFWVSWEQRVAQMIFILILPRGCAGCPQGQFGAGAKARAEQFPWLEREVGTAPVLSASRKGHASPARD